MMHLFLELKIYNFIPKKASLTQVTVKFKCGQLNSYLCICRIQQVLSQRRNFSKCGVQYATFTWYHPHYSNKQNKIFPNLACN